MLTQSDLLERILKIKNLKKSCFKYLEDSSKELLTHKIIFAMAKLTSKKLGPVKLSEIAQEIFQTGEKSKQDLIRTTIEKTLLKCAMIEKLRYASNDVRYILTGYRFQQIKELESFRGEREENVGDIFEIPKLFWPIPDEYFLLLAQKMGILETMKKLNSDLDKKSIRRGKYENLNREFTDNLNLIQKKLDSQFPGIEELLEK